MTQAEFDRTGFYPGMRAKYQGAEYDIANVDFVERLICLRGVISNAPVEQVWVRCESVEVVK